MPRRRPSAALIVALLALFVALGGPAGAANVINGKLLRKGTVSGKALKDRSVTTADISRKSIRTLQKTPRGSITATRLAPGAVGPAAIARGGVLAGNLATGSVGSLQVANASLTGADIADGGLKANDVGRVWGRFSAVVGPVPADSCWSGEPVGLAAERGHLDISNDVVLVTPGVQWPDKALSLTVRQSGMKSRFVLIACNPGRTVAATQVVFNYVIIDVP